jgi:predicted O-methyltransferase YrrM
MHSSENVFEVVVPQNISGQYRQKSQVISSIIDEIQRTGVVTDEAGNQHPLESGLEIQEGRLLYELIASDETIQKTIEIGCAYGLSSLYICSALSGKSNPKHTIVDPFQSEQWRGIGVLNLKRAGFRFFELIETASEFALPELVRREQGTFDLVFIDGWHTFDHTLLDLFYANRLIRVGGYIVIDDCSWASVGKAVAYFSNYPSYKIAAQSEHSGSWKRIIKKVVRAVLPPHVGQYIVPQHWHDRYYIRAYFSSMVALQKTSEDNRAFDWFHPF